MIIPLFLLRGHIHERVTIDPISALLIFMYFLLLKALLIYLYYLFPSYLKFWSKYCTRTENRTTKTVAV